MASWIRARLGSVRVRITLGAVLALGLVTVVGAVVLVAALQRTLREEVEDAARARAAEVVADLEGGTVPGQLMLDGGDDVAVQVVDSHARIVGASAIVEGDDVLGYPGRGESIEVPVPFDEDEFLVVSDEAHTEAGTYTVIVARTVDTVKESTQAIAGLLAIAVPLLLLVVGAVTWVVVGRALAPVEAIRREVDEISAAELHRRVPAPAGRDEIAGLAATMNRMLDRLERSQAQQRRFVSDASHELRSPVASIREHAEVALAHPDRAEVRDLAENVLAEDLRVQQLVDDLLLLARADEQALGLRLAPLDLDDVVFDEANRLRSTVGADLRVDTTAVGAARVDGDPASLRRVVRNLSDNAARHARGTVGFALAERDGHAVLQVDDDGPGVAEDQRERVFERFVRLDEARGRDAGGAGLGLAIVSELVRAHGGTVQLASNPSGGARVTLRLPLTHGARRRAPDVERR